MDGHPFPIYLEKSVIARISQQGLGSLRGERLFKTLKHALPLLRIGLGHMPILIADVMRVTVEELFYPESVGYLPAERSVVNNRLPSIYIGPQKNAYCILNPAVFKLNEIVQTHHPSIRDEDGPT
jgi:hypothetical protein